MIWEALSLSFPIQVHKIYYILHDYRKISAERIKMSKERQKQWGFKICTILKIDIIGSSLENWLLAEQRLPIPLKHLDSVFMAETLNQCFSFLTKPWGNLYSSILIKSRTSICRGAENSYYRKVIKNLVWNDAIRQMWKWRRWSIREQGFARQCLLLFLIGFLRINGSVKNENWQWGCLCIKSWTILQILVLEILLVWNWKSPTSSLQLNTKHLPKRACRWFFNFHKHGSDESKEIIFEVEGESLLSHNYAAKFTKGALIACRLSLRWVLGWVCPNWGSLV